MDRPITFCTTTLKTESLPQCDRRSDLHGRTARGPHRGHVRRTVPALAFGIGGIHLHYLGEVATASMDVRNRAHIGLESIGAELEALGCGRRTQAFDKDICSGLGATA